MNIDAVPESVTPTKVGMVLRLFGIDGEHITAGGVRIARDAIECEVYATDERGRRYVTTDEDGVAVPATHRIYISVRERTAP